MKKTFIISYDLKNASDKDYENLYLALREYGTFAHITESTWAIVTTEKAKEVRDKLVGVVPKGSTLIVIKSGGFAAWRNTICSNEWLKKHL
ncbi:CRISPR-associated protein Cas2 [uncultured Algoriphagus sp.]|uniref:CRISPR-associated protein Cas2 n=1 Tax=uncultured Algoriphagus sp. TaxID=417365 RepID=UPI0030ECC3C9|tara:strand:+ start:899 stop:1171 length:273 start_codon:yes stop_codon:yes gene_type:complete